MRDVMADTYDLAVIGSGPAGQGAATVATACGRRAIIIERHQPGGAVTTTGGAPMKTLREAALCLTGIQQEAVYGVRSATPLEVALPIIGARTQQVRDQLQSLVRRNIGAPGIGYLQGVAQLGAPGVVNVTLPDGTRRTLTAGTILVATGSRPAHPAGIPFDDPAVFDSDRIYSLRRLPNSIVIVGGGPVGVEFATVFTTLGVPVTLIDLNERLLPTIDGELAALMAAEFERRGVKLMLGAGVAGVSRIDGALTVTLSTGARLATDVVLFAAGRTANTEGLGLEAAGVRLDPRGRIVVDRYFQTSAAGVYAAGDVIGPTLASTALQQGRAAACHAFNLVFGLAIDRAASSAVYGLPEVAGVGLTEEQTQAAGIPYVVGRCDLAMTARGAIAGRGGRLKLIFRADDRKLLGVHCLGDIASELVGPGHVVLRVGGAVEIFLTLALNTPTYTSAYYDAAVDGLARLAALMRRNGHTSTLVSPDGHTSTPVSPDGPTSPNVAPDGPTSPNVAPDGPTSPTLLPGGANAGLSPAAG